MSVLIKGAKPPSGCRWCYFNEDSKCALIVGCDFDDTNGTQRRKDCPLVELPDHGDLIDRDALMARKGSAYDIDGHELYAVGTGTILRMPAVIPAERSDDENA